MTTSLLTFLQKTRPGWKLHLVTGPLYAGLFENDFRLRNTFIWDRSQTSRPPAEITNTRWDLVLDLQNNHASHTLTSACNPVPGHIRRLDKLHLNRWLLLLLRINTYRPDEHVCVRYAKTAGYDPLKHGPLPPIRIEPGPDDPVSPHRRLALVPFAAWKNKEWPREHFITVARYFADREWEIALFGGPNDLAAAREICRATGPACRNFAGDRPLRATGLLLARSRLCLGGDTGLMHLARACGVPTASIYGATTRHFGFFPFGRPAYLTFEHATACRPCHAHGGNVCWRLRRPCLRQVTPAQVITGVQKLLDQCTGTGDTGSR